MFKFLTSLLSGDHRNPTAEPIERKPAKRLSATELEEYFKHLVKPAYQFQHEQVQDISDLDSFTSSVFVGDPAKFKSKENGSPLTFLYQLKHPTKDVWYRVYIDDVQWDTNTYLLSDKNGELFTVERYNSNPPVELHPEVGSTSEYTTEPLNTKITYSQVKHVPDWETLGQIDNQLLTRLNEDADDYGEDIEAAREELGWMYGKSHWLGYPDWIQGLQVPQGFALSDFICELASDRTAGIGFGDAGSAYVFEKDGQFGISWQCY